MSSPGSDYNPGGSDPQSVGSDAVNALLDRASAMAQSLLEELGIAEPKEAAPPPPLEPTPETAPEPAADEPAPAPPAEPTPADGMPEDKPIDDQLAELEGLLDATQEQLGAEIADADKGTTTENVLSAAVPKAKGEPEVPDEPAAEPQPERGPGIEVDLEDGDGIPTLDGDLADGGEFSPASNTVLQIPPTLRNRVLVMAANLFCTFLDRCDRPFDRVSYPMRQALGLFALVTLLAALATLIMANL